ncbi:hypothetical protein N9I65_03570 [bacterium]|nr:hypothetical protein [bacterium]
MEVDRDSDVSRLEQETGYFELGMFTDAWELIETLLPDEKTEAPVLDLRLRILTALSQWDLGEHIASLLIHAGEAEKKTVARFYHAHARSLYESARYDDAREAVRHAVEAWRGIQKELSDDDLKALFRT